MATVVFTSSDAFMEGDERAVERAEVEVFEYIEGTYCDLRSGPHGNTIAIYEKGAWTLPDGSRFSDWAVKVDG